MKSKIEKLERVKPMALMGMMGDVAPQWVAKELNKIIDYLNSQDQEEKKTLEQIREEFDKERIKEWNKTAVETYKQATRDTPEELTDKKKGIDNGVDREDTPEELIKRKLKEITTSERVGFLYAVGDDDLLANELYDYIQQLLDEREREVEKNLFKRLYSARSKKEFREMLDKLKGKK